MKRKEEFERRNKLMIITTYGACEIPNNLNTYFENTRIEKLKRKKVTEILLMMVNSSFSYYDKSTESIYGDLTSKKTEEMTMSEWIQDYVWKYLKYNIWLPAESCVCSSVNGMMLKATDFTARVLSAKAVVALLIKCKKSIGHHS